MQIKIRLGLSGKLVFRHYLLFVQAEVAGVSPYEAARENPTRDFGEIFSFNGVEKTDADFGGRGDFFQTYATHFSFATEILTKGGHKAFTSTPSRFSLIIIFSARSSVKCFSRG
jgi:hypothetical protein